MTEQHFYSNAISYFSVNAVPAHIMPIAFRHHLRNCQMNMPNGFVLVVAAKNHRIDRRKY